MYKVVQIWPGQTVTCLHTNNPGHIWTTLYIYYWYWQQLKQCNNQDRLSPCITHTHIFNKVLSFPFHSLILCISCKENTKTHISFQAFWLLLYRSFLCTFWCSENIIALQSCNWINLRFLAVICLMKPSRAANTDTELDNPLVIPSFSVLSVFANH
jgi:hypothetical protein